MPLMTMTQLRSRPNRTGIECQQDRAEGGDKSYTCICDAVILCLGAKRSTRQRRQLPKGRFETAPVAVSGQEREYFCLRETCF
jgi:hypothetical protein